MGKIPVTESFGVVNPEVLLCEGNDNFAIRLGKLRECFSLNNNSVLACIVESQNIMLSCHFEERNKQR